MYSRTRNHIYIYLLKSRMMVDYLQGLDTTEWWKKCARGRVQISVIIIIRFLRCIQCNSRMRRKSSHTHTRLHATGVDDDDEITVNRNRLFFFFLPLKVYLNISTPLWTTTVFIERYYAAENRTQVGDSERINNK